MTLLEAIAALILLLISTIIILNKQKKTSVTQSPQSHDQTPELKPIVNDEPAVKPQIQQTSVTSTPALKTTEPSEYIEPAAQIKNTSNLPQDSILRRHYLAHLNSMIESLAPLRPTDSVLCRHYDTMLVAKLEQCLTNNQAMEQLIEEHENNKPLIPVAQHVVETKAPSAENNGYLPQDSIQRRHYLTHLRSMIESLTGPRPTDSVLCRHYDTMIVARLEQCLTNKSTLSQLISDFENQQ